MNENEVIDREMIRDCLARISRGEDRRDASLIRSGYWPDAVFDFGIFTGNFEEYLAWVVPGSPAVTNTLHTLGQTLISLRGSSAATETHVTCYHRMNLGAQERDVTMAGRYLDRLEKRDGQWRIIQRTLIYDWMQDFGPSADWSRGLMGAPFREERYTGRTHGDPSVDFFQSNDK